MDEIKKNLPVFKQSLEQIQSIRDDLNSFLHGKTLQKSSSSSFLSSYLDRLDQCPQDGLGLGGQFRVGQLLFQSGNGAAVALG